MSSARPKTPPWLALWLPLLVASAMAIVWMAEHWFLPDSPYAHGPLVLAVALVVLWSRRHRLRAIPGRWDRRGWFLLGPGLLVLAAGAALVVDSLAAVSLVLTVPGAFWLQQGLARTRAVWPVLLMPALALPMPFHITQNITFQLKELAVTAGLWLTGLLGGGAVRSGAYILVPGESQRLDVAAPCSGLNSLLALITIGYCVAFFLGPQRWPRRILLLLLAGPVAVGANIVRIAMLCLGAEWFGVPFATGTWHDLMGVLEWLLALGILLGLDTLVTRWTRTDPVGQRTPPPTAEDTMPIATGARVPLARALPLWLVCAGVAVLAFVRPTGGATDRAERLPRALAGWQVVRERPLTATEKALLGTADATMRLYGKGDHGLWVTAVFHDSNWKSVHPPRLCLEGSDMTTRASGDLPLPMGTAGVFYMTRNGATGGPGDARSYVSVYAYGAGSMVTGSYSGFVWHHAPRALLRNPTPGFLLRVEASPSPGEAEAAVVARARALLIPLIHAARGILAQGERADGIHGEQPR